MKCEDLKELISAFVDGELSQTQRDFIEEHMTHCRDCQIIFAEYTRIRYQMSSLRLTPSLPDIEKVILSKTRMENVFRKPRKWLRPVLIALPVILILAILLPILVPNMALTPEKVLAKASTALTNIQSYRMSGEYDIYDPNTKEFVLRAQGGFEFAGDRYDEQSEWIKPQNYYREVTGIGKFEVIGIGDVAYGRVEGTTLLPSPVSPQEWQLQWPSETQTRELLDTLTKIEKLPEENIDGVACFHYRGTVDMEKYISQNPQQADSFRTSTITEELWIGKDDYIIRQRKSELMRGEDLMAKMPMLIARSLEVWKYSDFNVPISIEPPLDAAGNLLPEWAVIQGK